MRKYNEIVLKQLKEHKKRSVLTLLGIIFALAMVITVGELGSFQKKVDLSRSIFNSGDAYAVFENISGDKLEKIKNNILVDKIGSIKEPHQEVLKINNEKSDIRMFSLDKNAIENIFNSSIKIREGRAPNNSLELLISGKGKEQFKIGDKIQGENKEFTVVGFFEKEGEEDLQKDIPKIFISGISDIEKEKTLKTFIKLKTNKNIVKSIDEVAQSIGITKKVDQPLKSNEGEAIRYNIYRINLEGEDVNVNGQEVKLQKPTKLLNIIIGAALVILTYISINASIQEKRKVYGVLRCIGADKGQVLNIVIKEGILIGIAAIIPGVLLGEVVSYIYIEKIFIQTINENFYGVGYEPSIKVILTGIAIVLGMIFIAIVKPMIDVRKISPIEGSKPFIKVKKEKRIHSKFIEKIFGIEGALAYKNLRRDKSNLYGITFVMIAVLAVFNVFTGYYNYEFNQAVNTRGALTKDIQITYESDVEKDIEDYIKKSNFVENYNIITEFNEAFIYENIDKNVIKDSTTVKHKKVNGKEVIVSNEVNMSLISVDDKGFEDIKHVIYGEEATLENFKNGGAILYSNSDRGHLNKPSTSSKFKVYMMDYNNYFEGLEDENKFKLNKQVELNLLGTTYLEDIFGSRESFGGQFIGIIIHEDTVKDKNFIEEGIQSKRLNFNLKDKNMEVSEENKFLEGIPGSMGYINNLAANLEDETSLRGIAICIYSLIAFITVIVILSLINIRDIVLNNRKKEFGIMFALGMDKKMLNKSLLYEGLIQCLIGLVIGNSISIISFIMISKSVQKFQIPWNIMILGSIGIIIVSALNVFNSVRKLNTDDTTTMMRNIE